jgi:hypothetical protein
MGNNIIISTQNKFNENSVNLNGDTLYNSLNVQKILNIVNDDDLKSVVNNNYVINKINEKIQQNTDLIKFKGSDGNIGNKGLNGNVGEKGEKGDIILLNISTENTNMNNNKIINLRNPKYSKDIINKGYFSSISNFLNYRINYLDSLFYARIITIPYSTDQFIVNDNIELNIQKEYGLDGFYGFNGFSWKITSFVFTECSYYVKLIGPDNDIIFSTNGEYNYESNVSEYNKKLNLFEKIPNETDWSSEIYKYWRGNGNYTVNVSAKNNYEKSKIYTKTFNFSLVPEITSISCDGFYFIVNVETFGYSLKSQYIKILRLKENNENEDIILYEKTNTSSEIIYNISPTLLGISIKKNLILQINFSNIFGYSDIKTYRGAFYDNCIIS